MKEQLSNQKYLEIGFQSRDEYLISLSERNKVPIEIVTRFAKFYGIEEDFQELILSLEIYTDPQYASLFTESHKKHETGVKKNKRKIIRTRIFNEIGSPDCPGMMKLLSIL